MVAFTLENPVLAAVGLVTLNCLDIIWRKKIYLGMNLIFFVEECEKIII